MTHTPRPWTLQEDQISGPDRQANARLIAAAPDLLHAAKDMFDLMCSGWPAQQAEGPEAEIFNAMRAAIAKATGDQ